jgi:glycosyltransferase involved in cell wall biosynthesis
MNKYVIVGSLPTESPLSYGGTTIAMAKMINYFKERNYRYNVIQTNSYYFKYSSIINYIIAMYNYLRIISVNDTIIVNTTAAASFYISPIFYALSRLFRCKFIFRKFAGNISILYEKQNVLVRYLFRKTILKSDLLFFETKSLVKYFRDMGIKNVHWLPNTREVAIPKYKVNSYKKRFVFISTVKRSKGIDEIVKVIGSLDEDCVFDIYGTITDKKYSTLYFDQRNVQYYGPLDPKKLLMTIMKYDIIVLPTYHNGEGYPGIIIDGYSLGKPCIATNWQSISEIVDHKVTGILIETQSTRSLLEAINYFNEENYLQMSKSAFKKFNTFENVANYNRMIDLIKDLEK